VPTRGPVTSFEIFQCARPGARFFRDSSPECSLAYPSRWQPAFVPDFRTLIFRDVEPGSAQAEFRFPDFGSGSARPAFLVTVREMSELEGLLAGSDWTGLASRVWPFFGGESVGNDWSVELEVAPRPAWAGAEFMVYMDDKRQHVWVWVRRIGRLVWILGGYAPERHRAYYGNLYAAMVASWRPDRAASPPARLVYPDLKSTALRVSSFGLIPAILAPIGLILLFLPRARDVSRLGLLHRFLGGSGARLTGPTPFGTPRDFAGFFFVIVAITGFFFLPHGQLTELGGRTEAPAETIDAGTIDEAGGSSGAPTSQGINALQIFVSGITCLLVLIVTLRRTASVNSILLVELLQLNIALVFLSVFFWFYGKLAWASEKSVWIQAAVLIILKLWDFLTSGKDITNANGRLFQRRDLVFLYAGYLMLVATAILYFSAERSSANNRVIERFFDAESLLCQGIIWLGCPLLLFGFLSRVRRWYGFAERVT